MKNIVSYYLQQGTSPNQVFSDIRIPIDSKYNCIVGLAFQKISNDNTSANNIRVGFSNFSGTILEPSPLTPVWSIDNNCSQKNIFRKCWIPIQNNELILNLHASSLSAELFYEVILLVDNVDVKKPDCVIYDFQHERILIPAGAGGSYVDSQEIKLKTSQDTIVGIIISSPVAGHVGFKNSAGEYYINKTNKLLFENTNGNNTNEDRFFPITIDKAKGRIFQLDFAPQVTQDNDFKIDLVFLVQYEKQTVLRGLGSYGTYEKTDVPIYPQYEFAVHQRPDNLSPEETEACNLIIYAYRQYEPIGISYLNMVNDLMEKYLGKVKFNYNMYSKGKTDPEKSAIPSYSQYAFATYEMPEGLTREEIEACEIIVHCYKHQDKIDYSQIKIVNDLMRKYSPGWPSNDFNDPAK